MADFTGTGTVTVGKWGNSRAIRLTKTMLDYLRAEDSTTLELSYEDDGILIRKKTSRKSLQEYAAPYGGTLGPYEEFDRGDGLGFERWIDEAD